MTARGRIDPQFAQRYEILARPDIHELMLLSQFRNQPSCCNLTIH